MKTLIVYYHPHEGSFCSAIRDAVEVGLHRGGHECKTIDLEKDGFDPVMHEKDLAAFVHAGRFGEHGLEGVDALALRYMKKMRWAEALRQWSRDLSTRSSSLESFIRWTAEGSYPCCPV